MRFRIFSTGAATAALTLTLAGGAQADPTLQDYRMFRALSVDLQGRIPTRDEVETFEAPGFDLDGWIDKRLQGEAYAERLRRVYLEALRLQVGNTFRFVPQVTLLHRRLVLDDQGKEVPVYYRNNQRRKDALTDGAFCFPMSVTGVKSPNNAPDDGTPKKVSKANFAKYAVKVKPWWLYKDYNKASPTQRYGDGWGGPGTGFELLPALNADPDGSEPTEVWVCKEEAAEPATGTVYASGLTTKPATLPEGRYSFPPVDSGFAKTNKGKPIDCTTSGALANSADCGCGPHLDRCLPGENQANSPRAFIFPSQAPFGDETGFDAVQQQPEAWWRYWWGQEAVRFLDSLFAEDRDFREILTSPSTQVNGPLTLFYRSIAPATCCGQGLNLGHTEPTPLFDPKGLPSLLAHDTQTWKAVKDRGPLASGLLTMPVFLTKYGSRRARAHVLYSAFLCREFVAENLDFAPSQNADLTQRPGCSACHAALEPLASYFGRVTESDWTYLPKDKYALTNPDCKPDASGQLTGTCRFFYERACDPDVAGQCDKTTPTLRGSHAALDHADQGPAGIASHLIGSPEFASCAVRNVTSSFLGRPLGGDDAPLVDELTETFKAGGFRMKKLVTAIVKTRAYREGNNLNSDAWRASEAP